MKPLTRAQREAVKRLFDRCPVYSDGKSADQLASAAGWKFRVHYDDTENPNRVTAAYWEHPNREEHYEESRDIVRVFKLAVPLTYCQFRRTVYQSHMDCLIVPWLGMTLGIEEDGYTHS